MAISNVRQYVGARYVPKFADPIIWIAGTSYESMVIVEYNNASYTSKIPVPPTIGNPADNPKYWALTGNYNAQVEEYRQETDDLKTQFTNVSTQVNDFSDKLSQQKYFITPQMFGAKGDGTTNDTKSFTDMCDYLKRNKGEAYIPTGNYIINDTLDLTGVGITINGSPHYASTITYTGNTSLFKIGNGTTNTNSVTIKNLNIENGNNTFQTAYCIDCNTGASIYLENIIIEGFNLGINFQHCTNSHISDYNFYCPQSRGADNGIGLNIGNDSVSSYFSTIQINFENPSKNNIGIKCTDGNIRDLYFNNVDIAGAKAGVMANGANTVSPAIPTDILFNETKIDGCEFAFVLSNFATDESGIVINGGWFNCVNVAGAPAYQDISLYNVRNVNITNIHFMPQSDERFTKSQHIYIQQDCKNISIDNCKSNGCLNFIVCTDASVDGLIISNNSISDATNNNGAYIVLQNMKNAVINGNILTTNGSYGILVSTVTNAIITSNIVDGIFSSDKISATGTNVVNENNLV